MGLAAHGRVTNTYSWTTGDLNFTYNLGRGPDNEEESWLQRSFATCLDLRLVFYPH